MLKLVVKLVGKEYDIEVPKNTAIKVSDLKQIIQTATGVEVDSQKLLNIDHKVKDPSEETKLFKLGLQPGHKILLIRGNHLVEQEENVKKSENEATDNSSEIKKEANLTSCVIQAVLGNKMGDYRDRIDPNHTCCEENQRVLDPTEYEVQIQQLVKNGDFKLVSAPRKGKKLLVLDLDHTVFDNDKRAVTKHELIRPFLHEFLTRAYKNYDLMIWSATSMESLEAKIVHYGVATNPNYKSVACFDVTTMLKIEVPGHGSLAVKPLAVIWGKFPGVYTPNNTIILEDTPRNFLLNPKNGVLIRSFRDAHLTRREDEELKHLTEYLDEIALVEDLSEIDHGKWEEHRMSNGGTENFISRECEL